VYGHTPVSQPDWLNRTINIDTGCVFGHALTALRWPEKEMISVPAEPRRLFAKRSLALREFALGVEGLERFVRGEPLRRIHECVFGVLAMESEPVDPRL
jgi:hypothetical protein